MSSTNRSKIRYEHDQDYYVTPLWVIREFLRAWDQQTTTIKDFQTNNESCFILDPCAGGDSSGNIMSYPTVLNEWGLDTVTMDIRPDSPCQYPVTNFLDAKLDGIKFDMVMTNPPYNIATQIIERSMEVVKPMGWIVMLLRINFLGSQTRGSWFANNMPHSIYTHSKRPGFYPDNWKEVMPWLTKKGTDSTEYGHFVWQNVPCSNAPYQGFVIPHVKGVSDAPGPCY
jgi:hypothetical protein